MIRLFYSTTNHQLPIEGKFLVKHIYVKILQYTKYTNIKNMSTS